MINAGRRNRSITTALRSYCVLAMFSTAGCVTQSTYDAALQEGITTRSELERTKDEQRILTRQVSELELRNADVMREAEAALAALHQAGDEAEREYQAIEQRLGKLAQKVTQATKQQRALQYELTVAKENGAALQELIDVYQRKVRDNDPITSTAEPAVHKPFDPSTIPLPQDLPAAPAVTPPQPTPPPTPAPTPAASPTRHSQPPQDDGWFSSITNWLVSLWRSVFS
jgi:hypothetical protein